MVLSFLLSMAIIPTASSALFRSAIRSARDTSNFLPASRFTTIGRCNTNSKFNEDRKDKLKNVIERFNRECEREFTQWKKIRGIHPTEVGKERKKFEKQMKLGREVKKIEFELKELSNGYESSCDQSHLETQLSKAKQSLAETQALHARQGNGARLWIPWLRNKI